MAFVCTFVGLSVALTVWATLYALFSSSDNPALIALAPHLEAFSVGGWCLFIFLTVAVSFLTYRLLKAKGDTQTPDRGD